MMQDASLEVLYDNRRDPAFPSVLKRHRRRLLFNILFFAMVLALVTIITAPPAIATREPTAIAIWFVASLFPVVALIIGLWITKGESAEIRVVVDGVWLSPKAWIPREILRGGFVENRYGLVLVRPERARSGRPVLAVARYLIANPRKFEQALGSLISPNRESIPDGSTNPVRPSELP